MIEHHVDILIVGAGPVGLMCAYLGQLCGLRILIIDKSTGPLEVGRADALNARTLQLLELINLFNDLYPLGKICNTSSVWKDGHFISRQSVWWDELQGCLHKHFLMLGQPFIEKLLDQKMTLMGNKVKRMTTAENIQVTRDGCKTTLSSGEVVSSTFIIGADGSRSFVREFFNIPFQIIRPQMIWAVIDGIIDTHFPKVPEIISFQTETADVAWIPREDPIDRFYVRMDTKDFSQEEAIEKIRYALKPYTIHFKQVVWFSQFSVKESVAYQFFVEGRVFLAGDSGHIHSVNGGQGLNTGLSDAFNLIWKINMVLNHGFSERLLQTYEDERRPVALDVVETSGELVRATKYSVTGTHAEDYVHLVQKHAGNITGMGIHYKKEKSGGHRLFDFIVFDGNQQTRLYSLLQYTHFTLLIFGDDLKNVLLPQFIRKIHILSQKNETTYWSHDHYYRNQAILVRPDAYIEMIVPLNQLEQLLTHLTSLTSF